MKIDAILSDYDGTLCPTSSISQDNSNSSIIPERLETIIWNISEKIDICIVPSKDFSFFIAGQNLLKSFHVLWALKL